jgi:hypothetical protein
LARLDLVATPILPRVLVALWTSWNARRLIRLTPDALRLRLSLMRRKRRQPKLANLRQNKPLLPNSLQAFAIRELRMR